MVACAADAKEGIARVAPHAKSGLSMHRAKACLIFVGEISGNVSVVGLFRVSESQVDSCCVIGTAPLLRLAVPDGMRACCALGMLANGYVIPLRPFPRALLPTGPYFAFILRKHVFSHLTPICFFKIWGTQMKTSHINKNMLIESSKEGGKWMIF